MTAKSDLVLNWLLTSGARIALLLAVAALLLRMIRLFTDRFSRMLQGLTQQSLEQQKRAQTLSYAARTVATTVLVVITGMLLLGEVGVNVAPLLAAAGIGGGAAGFCAQNLVRDVNAGFFILLDEQIQGGDGVNVADENAL